MSTSLLLRAAPPTETRPWERLARKTSFPTRSLKNLLTRVSHNVLSLLSTMSLRISWAAFVACSGSSARAAKDVHSTQKKSATKISFFISCSFSRKRSETHPQIRLVVVTGGILVVSVNGISTQPLEVAGGGEAGTGGL